MKRLMLQASALALAVMTPAVADAQIKDRVIEEARPAISRTLADRLLKKEPQLAASLDGSERADPSRVVYAVEISEGKPASFAMTKEPEGARKADVIFKKKISRADRPKTQAPDPLLKINPALRKEIASMDAGKRIEALIVFDDPVGIPRFPEPAAGERGQTGAERNYAARREEIVKTLQARRAADEQPLAALRQYEAKILERFWLINAVLVDIPAGAIEKLAADARVLAIDPSATDIPPPQNADTSDDVDDGRAIIRSDPYFNLGLNAGFIGLLDTGVRDTHEVFASPDNLDFLRDCVGGGADCNTGAITTTDPWPHGTASAAIITGGTGGGAPFRGVTDVTLDSFRVYGAADGTRGGLNVTAAVRGFQRAVAVGDRVIVGEIQLPRTFRNSTSSGRTRRTPPSIQALSSCRRTATIPTAGPAFLRRRSRISRSASAAPISEPRGRMRARSAARRPTTASSRTFTRRATRRPRAAAPTTPTRASTARQAQRLTPPARRRSCATGSASSARSIRGRSMRR